MKRRRAPAIRATWDRIEAWCKRHLPRVLRKLNPGASARTIEALERAIGRPLPTDVCESFAIHDGGPKSFLFGYDLLSTEAVIHEWERWRGWVNPDEDPLIRSLRSSSPAGAIEPDYFNPGWIPVMEWPGITGVAVDLSPGPTGRVGQVINYGRDDSSKHVLASGWAEFLAEYASFLESLKEEDIDPDAKSLGECYDEYLERLGHDLSMDRGWPLPK
jgi:cell wall assembly regulator SMI1